MVLKIVSDFFKLFIRTTFLSITSSKEKGANVINFDNHLHNDSRNNFVSKNHLPFFCMNLRRGSHTHKMIRGAYYLAKLGYSHKSFFLHSLYTPKVKAAQHMTMKLFNDVDFRLFLSDYWKIYRQLCCLMYT